MHQLRFGKTALAGLVATVTVLAVSGTPVQVATAAVGASSAGGASATAQVVVPTGIHVGPVRTVRPIRPDCLVCIL